MFSTMTRISIASLRLTNPRFKITIVLDEISEELLRKSSDPLLMEVDEVMILPTPNGNNVFRNRHIKTRLGTLVRGPFLFLDSDTIIRGDISAIFNFNGNVAGVPNLCQKTIEKQVWDQDLKTLKKMNPNAAILVIGPGDMSKKENTEFLINAPIADLNNL